MLPSPILSIFLQECSQGRYNEETETIFSVINAFDVPSYLYVKENRKFILDKTPKKLLAPASSRSEYIRNRYNTILQRILRHDLFAPNANENIKTSDSNSKKFVLRYSENLLSASTVEEVVMLGLLSKFKEGKFYLEDPSGAIPIDLSEAKFHSGLYTEGAFMLADGTYNDGVLKVSGLGFPPPEASASSRAYFGTLNYWGGPSQTLLKYSKRLLEFERLNFGGTIIFLSDCWLDDAAVMEKLKKLFMGFDDSPPIAIVMMGPFQKNKETATVLRSKFAQLAEIIDSTFTLKNETDIVLVPDIEDPTSANILPRPPLPATVVQDLLRKNKRVILATNPCRLQYCSQQIVVCRMDLLRKLCRNTIKFPETGELADHVSFHPSTSTVSQFFLFLVRSNFDLPRNAGAVHATRDADLLGLRRRSQPLPAARSTRRGRQQHRLSEDARRLHGCEHRKLPAVEIFLQALHAGNENDRRLADSRRRR